MLKKPYLILIIAVVLAALFVVFFLAVKMPTNQAEQPEPAEKERPPGRVGPLAQGKQTYTIISDKPKKLQIIEVSFDPLDVKKGETQTVIVKVLDTDNDSITSDNGVSVTYYTDNTSSTISLLLRRADGPDLVTTWEGLWESEDTHDFVYQATVKATSAANESSVTLSFR